MHIIIPVSTTANHKLLRCVRLDDSDLEIFEQAAEPGEWVVPGGFEFLDDEHSLSGRRLQAFRCGFLGLTSFGRTTLATIASASEPEFRQAIEALAQHFVDRYGAPDPATAAPAAREEIEYAESLCEYPEGTLICIERELDDNGISEKFKRFVPSNTADWQAAKPIGLKDLMEDDEHT